VTSENGAAVIPITAPAVGNENRLKCGWLGVAPMTIEIDVQLVLALGGIHVRKVMVTRKSPAWKAGARTGDYLQSVSPSPTAEIPFDEFEAMGLPNGTEVYLKLYRPQHRARMILCAKLCARPEDRALPKWKMRPPVPPGRHVKRNERHQYEAAMATHPLMSSLGFRILMRILKKYDGPNGAYPSYETLSRDMSKSRRWVIEQVQRLASIGTLHVVKNGAPTSGRPDRRSNMLRPCWPEGWGANCVGLRSPYSRPNEVKNPSPTR